VLLTMTSCKYVCLFALHAFLLVFEGLAQDSTVGLTRVIDGLSNPVALAHAGDDSGRLFIVEQNGRVRICHAGVLLDTAFLDITDRVLFQGERGLLGLAFPPGFAGKNYFYVYYTSFSGDNVVARYSVNADNPNVADVASESILLTFPHRTFSNHNGGQLAFSPVDGYLYIGLGDGGGAGDPFGNAQNTGSLLGKILRIDVESGATPYAIPPDNPFVFNPQSRPEIWAYGLRNPWRFSFDRFTGELYIGDAGQNSYEEVDYQPPSPGGENFGWKVMEGTHCYPVDDGNCSTDGLTLPVIDYDHRQGDCAIVGGYVYRGGQYPSLQEAYVYGDYCSGRIWGLRWDAALGWYSTLLLRAPFQISAFGEDQDGNLYVSAYNTGEVYLVTAQSM